MRSTSCLTLIALAGLAGGANAANVTNWGVLGPTADVAFVTYHDVQTIDDIYTFSIGAESNVDGYAEEFEARSVSMPDAAFTLFSGVYGAAGVTQVGAPMPFDNTAAETLYTSLPTGEYYFQITGQSAGAGSAYDFEAYANQSGGGASQAPEPENTALMLSGLALLGFLATRRSRR